MDSGEVAADAGRGEAVRFEGAQVHRPGVAFGADRADACLRGVAEELAEAFPARPPGSGRHLHAGATLGREVGLGQGPEGVPI